MAGDLNPRGAILEGKKKPIVPEDDPSDTVFGSNGGYKVCKG